MLFSNKISILFKLSLAVWQSQMFNLPLKTCLFLFIQPDQQKMIHQKQSNFRRLFHPHLLTAAEYNIRSGLKSSSRMDNTWENSDQGMLFASLLHGKKEKRISSTRSVFVSSLLSLLAFRWSDILACSCTIP